MANGTIVKANAPCVIAGGCENELYRYPRHIDFQVVSGSLAASPGQYSGLLMQFVPALRSDGGTSPSALGARNYIFDAGPFIMPFAGILQVVSLTNPTTPITFDYTDVYCGPGSYKGQYYLTMPEMVNGSGITIPRGALAFKFSCKDSNPAAPTTNNIINVSINYFGFSVTSAVQSEFWQSARCVRQITPVDSSGKTRLTWKISIFGETAHD